MNTLFPNLSIYGGGLHKAISLQFLSQIGKCLSLESACPPAGTMKISQWVIGWCSISNFASNIPSRTHWVLPGYVITWSFPLTSNLNHRHSGWRGLEGIRTFARKFSNIHFFSENYTIERWWVSVVRNVKKNGGHRLRFGENMPGRTLKFE